MATTLKTRVYQAMNIMFLIGCIIIIDVHFASLQVPDPNPHHPHPPAFPQPTVTSSAETSTSTVIATTIDSFLEARKTHHHGSSHHHHHSHNKSAYLNLMTLLAPFAFWMTPLIHALLFAPAIAQFTVTGERFVNDVVQWRFIAIGLSSLLSYSFFVTSHPILSFIVSLWLLAATTELLYQIHKTEAGTPTNWYDLIAYVPFSFLQAWTFVIVIWNAWDMFPHHRDSVLSKIMYSVVLLVFLFESVAYAFVTKRGEIPGSIAMTYALVCMAISHRNLKFYFVTSIVASVLSLFPIAKSVFTTSEDLRQGLIALPDEEIITPGL